MQRISVVGLGKLGACIAACIAKKGMEVIGVDVNRRTVDLINAGQAPVLEPGLGELIRASRNRLRATSDYRAAVLASDASFVVVPTPSDEMGAFTLGHVLEAMAKIARVLRDKPGYHLVVVSSTVLPGSTEHGVRPVLERESGKECGADFGLCYSPEFIALGSVIHDFFNPDFVLIGESDAKAGAELAAFYRRVCDNDPPVRRMNFVNAELTKIAVNAYVTMKITFANMLAAICEQVPHGDIDVVTSALGLDRRIGPRYLKGALGYGGPCFPRDNVALAYFARQVGQPATLAEATDAYNRGIVDRVVQKVASYVPEAGTVALLGVAYKPETDVIEESQGLQLAARLADKGLKVIVFDPVATERARSVLGDRVAYADDVRRCVRQADVVVFANPDRAFEVTQTDSLPIRPDAVVVDLWRLLRERFENGTARGYWGIGLGRDDSDSVARLKQLWGCEDKG